MISTNKIVWIVCLPQMFNGIEDYLDEVSLFAFFRNVVGEMWQAKAQSIAIVDEYVNDSVAFDTVI